MRNKNAKVSDPNKFVTSSGEKFHINYSPKVLPDGRIELIESGKEDISEYINSFRDSTDMAFILNRLAMGDTSVLNKSIPTYGDFTEMPKTYAESLQLVIDSKKKFYELPLDVRNKFDNDYQKWFVTAGSDVWIEKMGYTKSNQSDVAAPSADEVKEDA